MAVIDSFLKILRPLNIYNLSENSNVYNELLTYAKELDILNLEIETLLREGFIFTAESYGLSNIEKIYTAEDTQNTPQSRRDKILERLKLNDSSFSLKEMENALKSLGVKEYKILEYPARLMLVFEITGDYTEAEISFIKSEIHKLAPVSYDIQINFWGLTWNEFESRNLSFNSLDLQNLSWQEIDELK